jgi:chorismate dehydratase
MNSAGTPAFSQILKGTKDPRGSSRSRWRRTFAILKSLSRPITLVNPVRISIVEYLNTAPLVRGFTHGPLRGKYELSFTVPSQCAEALRSGAVDVAIIPAIEYQRIPDLVILPNLSIASKKSVRSLLLVSQKPIQEVTRIALDRSSRSTQALTRILCQKRWHIQPEFFEAAPDLPVMLQQADAALLIGDPALRLAIACASEAHRDASGEVVSTASLAGLSQSGSVYIYDIVEKWRAMTNLPAVLAVWAARREAVTPQLVQDFQDSLAFGLQHVDAIASEAAVEMKLPAPELRRYLLENIDYHLDEENLRGLTRYYQVAAELGLISQVNKIALAPGLGGPARSMDVVAGVRGNPS